MENLGANIANNLIYLRKKAGLTQLEFGEKFNYTDKTVSRWENGSVIPSVETLKEIADYYGVTLDYLVSEHRNSREFESSISKTINAKNKIILMSLFVTVIVFISMTVYIASVYDLGTADPNVNRWWVTFLWMVPFSSLGLAFLTNRYFKGSRWTIIYMSCFVWSILLSAYITFIAKGNYWYLFFIGLPVQVALILFRKLRKSQ
ncbi:MAG: helix-turn-helix domain-containing protein [Bacilli bacterium]|nr:helix-turn-helix domain-containing protein [Bacilli bacterium]